MHVGTHMLVHIYGAGMMGQLSHHVRINGHRYLQLCRYMPVYLCML
uniref:Uncharacterized protein n=1 Tax=Rhizophora mucronata TaxID=61149 RepID=A0A2P2NXR2_RHIMU